MFDGDLLGKFEKKWKTFDAPTIDAIKQEFPILNSFCLPHDIYQWVNSTLPKIDWTKITTNYVWIKNCQKSTIGLPTPRVKRLLTLTQKNNMTFERDHTVGSNLPPHKYIYMHKGITLKLYKTACKFHS